MPVPELTPAELAARLAAPGPPVLLDVRGPEEHVYVTLPGARLVPLPEFMERLAELQALRGQEVVAFCHHGPRSYQAAAFLRAQGVDATSLAGGIDRYAREVDPELARY